MEGIAKGTYEGDLEVVVGRDWQRLGAGGVVFKRREAEFWYTKGFILTRTIDFSVPYDAIATIQEERPGRVVFRFSIPQPFPDHPPVEVMAVAFKPLVPEDGRECVEGWRMWYGQMKEQLEEQIFSRCKVTGRFSVDEGVGLYSGVFPPGVGNAREEVTNVIVNLIKSGRLDGFFDEESGQYTAAALIGTRVTQVSVDFNSLLAALGDKGIVLQHLTCPSCGGKLSLPQGGDLIECEYCGAAVRAVDMFEKFKGLLGL